MEEKPNNNFPIYLNVCYITQNIQIFLQWVFVSEMPCNPQTYGVWARKGNAKCHEKNSWRKGKASTKFSSSTIGRKPVEYKDILLPKSIYDIVCCQTPPNFHSLHTDCTTEHHLDLWYALSAKVEHSSYPRRSFAGVAHTTISLYLISKESAIWEMTQLVHICPNTRTQFPYR